MEYGKLALCSHLLREWEHKVDFVLRGTVFLVLAGI